MRKLEQRIRSLQNASVMNCATCGPVLLKMKSAEDSLASCHEQREAQLKELSRVM